MSTPIQIVWRKKNTCHIIAFERLMMTSFIHFCSSSKTLHMTAEQINSNITMKHKPPFGLKVNSTRGQGKHTNLPSCMQCLWSTFQLGKLGVLSALSSPLIDEKQYALFHYTVNPISCFTLHRRAAGRGNEWDDIGKCWHKSHNPKGDTSRSMGYS